MATRFDELTNPPTTFVPFASYGQVADVGLNSAFVAPSTLNALGFDGNIPTVSNYSAGIEAKLPWGTDLDVSYVGSSSHHLIQRFNQNAIPYGATFLVQNQDPTKVKANPNALLGSNAFNPEFLVQYTGFQDSINTKEFSANANYNSLQVALNRRFAGGLFFGVVYTWSKCMDVADTDGNFGIRIDQFSHAANYGPCGFNVTHNFAANYVYWLPSIPSSFGGFNNAVTRTVLNHWQISGFTSFIKGTPIDPSFSIGGAGNQNITGSYTEPGRLVCLSNPSSGTTSSPYNRINPVAFAEPVVGSIGLGCSRNLITGPGVNDWGMALKKTFPITERAQFQLHVEAFNVFNHTQFNGYNSGINFSSLTNPHDQKPAVQFERPAHEPDFRLWRHQWSPFAAHSSTRREVCLLRVDDRIGYA